MKRSIKSLLGYTLKETDGEIGKVDEFYFDDQSWTIRYLIVKTGNWFSGKKVLISPEALRQPDWQHKEFPVRLTQKQIKNSPDIDTDKPVSRQQEEQLSAYYPWPGYWGVGGYAFGARMPGMLPGAFYRGKAENKNPKKIENSSSQDSDQHLRSTKKVMGYNIHATDGQIGEVDDYIIDDNNWEIKFLVVDTGTWLNSRKVLVSTEWIKEVNWDNSVVIVNITTEQVKDSPEFDDSEGVNDSYERNLYDYYGRRLVEGA